MPESLPFRTLTRHFTRMLYATGEDASQTGTTRMLAGVAAPMLLAAFWLVLLESRVPIRFVPPWSLAELHYLFVLYSICVMACVTALQWERLFPSRADFLILLPLPIHSRTLFGARLASVASFLGMFLLASNLFGTLIFPMLYGAEMPRAMLSHAVAVFTAGIASSLAVLALEALIIVIVPERWFHHIAPIVQTLIVTVSLTLFLRVFTVGEHLPSLLQGDIPVAAKLPALWFLSLYETLLGGPTATPYAAHLSHHVAQCLPVLLMATALLYPTAWKRRQRMAIEGAHTARRSSRGIVQQLLHRILLRDPDQRAIFHFLTQTLTRLSRYHVMLAAYCGSGIALAVAISVTFNTQAARLTVSIDPAGIHKALPILLFWTVAGLRVAFLLPEELRARWIFQMAPLITTRVVTTIKLFVLLVCLVVIAVFTVTLATCHWNTADIFRQDCFCTAAAILLTDVFFFLTDSVPFTRPAQPERSSLPLTLAMYIFGVPVFLSIMFTLEYWARTSLVRLASALLSAVAIHALLHFLRRLPSHSVSSDPFLGESDSDVRTLGLST
ncbi:hypothetical protein [Terriglobus sp. RCC_193]|uniref:hypothetical protein n=1 Tax=Terriglobus sp. RCC_193 TaxID=3239218 RepID=UPI003524D6FA